MNARTALWNDYARVFSLVTSRFQQEMYELAASRLSGSVIDCGCGTAKLVPYLAAGGGVSGYLGVDSSSDMIARARRVIDRFPGFDCKVELRKIEDARGKFDSAVSLQSYYSWTNGAGILARIRTITRAGGSFVLATANEDLDAEKLLSVASRDLLMSPDWEKYVEINRVLADKDNGNFVSLDSLIGDVRTAGFKVREAHTELYDGGLSFMVLES